MNPLDELIMRETVSEILDLLTPAELVVAILRTDGLTDTEIADFLAVDPSAVHRRMDRAKRRIMEQLPEAAHLVRGRSKRPLPGKAGD